MDSELSASELRARYNQGGSAADSELSAAQLRARYGVAHNSKDFSTRDTGSSNGMFIAIAVLAIAAAVGYLFFK